MNRSCLSFLAISYALTLGQIEDLKYPCRNQLQDFSLPSLKGNKFVGPIASFEPEGLQFAQPISVIFPVDLSQYKKLNALKAYLYDESIDKWIPTPITNIDEENGLVTASIDHFSSLALALEDDGLDTTHNIDDAGDFDMGFGCGTIKDINRNGGPPKWPLDLILLASLMLWFGLRNAKFKKIAKPALLMLYCKRWLEIKLKKGYFLALESVAVGNPLNSIALYKEQMMIKKSIALMSTIAVICALSIFPGNADSATYYVSPSGSDSNSGTTASSPWETITKAADTAVAGDTVIVKAGTYTDPTATSQEAFNPANSGTSTNPITFKSDPPLAAILIEFKSGVPALAVYGRNNIVIDGFKVEGRLGVYYSDHITIQNNEVIKGGIQAGDASLNWGIIVHTADDNIIRDNYVHDMLHSGNSSHNTAGIMVGFIANRNIIERNYVDAGGGTVYSAYGQKGGDINDNTWNNNIAENAKVGFLGMGSTDGTKWASDNNFFNNTIINCTIGAFELDHNTQRFKIQNNTAYNCTSFLHAIKASNIDHEISYNIGVGYTYAIRWEGYSEVSGSIVTPFTSLINYSDNNCFHEFPSFAYREKTPTLNYTFAEWKDATSHDSNSYFTDPLFEDVDKNNFTLKQSSPCKTVDETTGQIQYWGASDADPIDRPTEDPPTDSASPSAPIGLWIQ